MQHIARKVERANTVSKKYLLLAAMKRVTSLCTFGSTGTFEAGTRRMRFIESYVKCAGCMVARS